MKRPTLGPEVEPGTYIPLNQPEERGGPFRVYRDGEMEIEEVPTVSLGEYVVLTAQDAFEAGARRVGRLASNVALEARMAVYDKVHGTHFRSLKHEKARIERNLAMARKLGLLTSDDEYVVHYDDPQKFLSRLTV